MKNIFALLLFILISSPVLAAEMDKKEAVFDDIFPKPSELAGGATAWIASDLVKTGGVRYVLYEKNYTYYSTKKQRILDIERNNTYSVSVRVFACENLDIASERYKNLTAVDEDIKRKKMTSPAPFGERGVLLALPTKGQHADYYITFLFRSFVVQVYSDDGFAQIDMADDIEKRLSVYLKTKGIDFHINKINLEVTYGDISYAEQVNFAGSDVSVVVLEGAVFDSASKPVKGAKITVRETGQTVLTRDNGKYSIEITTGWGKAIYLAKTIFLPSVAEDRNSRLTGIYPLKVTNAGITVLDGAIDIFIAGNKILGKFLDIGNGGVYNVEGSLQADNVSFAIGCATSSSNMCRRVFKGTVDDKGFMKGRMTGGGGSGHWELDSRKFSIIKEGKYLRDTGINLERMRMDNGRITTDSGVKAPIDNLDKKSFIKISIKEDALKDPFYFKKGVMSLELDGITLEKEAKLVLYEILEKDNGTAELKEAAVLASLHPKSSYVSISVDISSPLRYPRPSGYALGLKGGGKRAVLMADTALSFAELYYYRDAEKYKPIDVVSAAVKTFSGNDIASNANKIKPDGEADIVLSLDLTLAGRRLESIEIMGIDGNIRHWNTNPFDIYPAVAVMSGGNMLNDQDGSIAVMLEKETETFDLNIYKGSFGEDEKGSFIIKVVIDGKTYESGKINFH